MSGIGHMTMRTVSLNYTQAGYPGVDTMRKLIDAISVLLNSELILDTDFGRTKWNKSAFVSSLFIFIYMSYKSYISEMPPLLQLLSRHKSQCLFEFCVGCVCPRAEYVINFEQKLFCVIA